MAQTVRSWPRKRLREQQRRGILAQSIESARSVSSSVLHLPVFQKRGADTRHAPRRDHEAPGRNMNRSRARLGASPPVRPFPENSWFSVGANLAITQNLCCWCRLNRSCLLSWAGGSMRRHVPEVRTSCGGISSSFFIRAKRQPATPRKRRSARRVKRRKAGLRLAERRPGASPGSRRPALRR